MKIQPYAIGNYYGAWSGTDRKPSEICVQHPVRPIPRRRQWFLTSFERSSTGVVSLTGALNAGQSALLWGYECSYVGTITTATFRGLISIRQGVTDQEFVGIVPCAVDAAGTKAPKTQHYCCTFPAPSRLVSGESLVWQSGDGTFGASGTVLVDVAVLLEVFEPAEQMDWPTKEIAATTFPAGGGVGP